MAPRTLTAEDLAIADIVRAAITLAHTGYDAPAIVNDAIPSIVAMGDRQTDPEAIRIMRGIAALLAPEDTRNGALSFVATRLAQHSYRLACDAAGGSVYVAMKGPHVPIASVSEFTIVAMAANREAAQGLGVGDDYDRILATLQPPEVRP